MVIDKLRNVVCVTLLAVAVAIAGYPQNGTSTTASDGEGPSAERAPHAFKVQQDENGKYWFVSPRGERFLSIGINNVLPLPWRPKPGTQYYDAVNTVFGGDFEKWKADVVDLLVASGFNTLGSWSDNKVQNKQLYGTICLYVAGYAHDRCLDGLRPGFEKRVRDNTTAILSANPNIDNVLGFYLDNEMPWYGKSAWDQIPNYTLLEVAFELPPQDPAHQAARRFLIDRYKSADDFGRTWGREIRSWDELGIKYIRKCVNARTQQDRAAFTALAAERFFATASRVVRELAPGRLILGTRFSRAAPEPVVRACGKYCDVITFNDYRRLPKADDHLLTRYWIWSGKPLIVTEFSWRGEENTSGNPNTRGAGTVVKTQAQRGKNYQGYVEDLLSYPMVIGAHWFQFADQSPQGRFDGEDSNYGIVDIKHRRYRELLEAMTQTNTRVSDIHAQSSRSIPTSLPKARAVVFEPGQHPERPPHIDLIAEEPILTPELFHADDASISFYESNHPAIIKYDTGELWGCGILFHGPKRLAIGRGPKHATDLDGYSVVVIDAEIPRDLFFEFFVDEAGVAPADAEVYNTEGGDDGESFTFKLILGKGERFTYRFELKELLGRTTHGNQKGLRRVNMNSMKGFAMYFHGRGGSGTIRIHSFELTR
jgi:hypothetical protein